MIEFIRIRGFQSHIDSYIELSKKMTAITGLSMDGKTAVLRGFKFAKDNRPLGTKFRYKYEDIDTIIDIGADGHIISHIKSSRPLNKEGHKSLYVLKYPNGNTKEFSAYGADVPSDIRNILNISDICIQNQLDPYMLVISTSGQIASTINKITGIDVSDKWLKKIRTATKELGSEKAIIQKSQKTITEELKPYDGIDEIKNLITKANQIQDEYDKILYDANKIIDSVEIIRASGSKLTAKKLVLNELKDYIDNYDRILSETKKITTADSFRDKIITVEKKYYSEINKKAKLLDSIQLVSKIIDSINYTKKVNLKLKQIDSTKALKDIKISDLKTAKEKYISSLLSAGKCYVCGSELNDYERLSNQI